MRTVSRATLDEDLKWYSDTVSKGVRTTAFGTIAGIWAVLTATGLSLAPTGAFGIDVSRLVTAAFVLASFTLLVDILQYVAAYLMTDIGIDRWQDKEKKGETVEFTYSLENLGYVGFVLYWINYLAFRAKLLLAIGAGGSFVLLAFAIQIAA